MTPLEISAVVFACVFGGAMLGLWLGSIVPQHHLSDQTKNVVTLGVGLIGTMAALVLGLLVASAQSSYSTRAGELTQMAANTILLDRALAHYGPETREIRAMLKSAVVRMIDQVWPKDGTQAGGISAATNGEVMFDRIQELVPRTDAQRLIQSQAESMAINLGQTRWLLFEQAGSSISMPFLVIVVFWLTAIFVSFGLFAPRNATVFVTMLVSAMSVAGAIFLILELDRPFSGLVRLSSTPLSNALVVLGK
jgi:hypothetical protein